MSHRARRKKWYQRRRYRAFIFGALVALLATVLGAGRAHATPAPPHKKTCDAPVKWDPNLGGGDTTTYIPTYTVDGLKMKTELQVTYPHQVMAQTHVIGNARHGDITDFHLAMVYVAPNGTENTCQVEKGTIYSLHGSWIDDLDTSYWWVQSPTRGDRILVQVQVTVTNPRTMVSWTFGKIKRLRVPIG
jgi:hypothetical protein